MGNTTDVGKIGWIDITVDDAEGLKDFYATVTGWKPERVDMGEYADFNMTMPESGNPSAGICHARGANSGIPNQWLIYIVVADVDTSATACAENGGKVLIGPKDMEGGRLAVIEDPSGAVAALYQAP